MILVLFFVLENVRVWVYWNRCFEMHVSCLGPGSCCSPSWISFGVHHWGGCSGWWLYDSNILCLLKWQATSQSIRGRVSSWGPTAHGHVIEVGDGWAEAHYPREMMVCSSQVSLLAPFSLSHFYTDWSSYAESIPSLWTLFNHSHVWSRHHFCFINVNCANLLCSV